MCVPFSTIHLPITLFYSIGNIKYNNANINRRRRIIAPYHFTLSLKVHTFWYPLCLNVNSSFKSKNTQPIWTQHFWLNTFLISLILQWQYGPTELLKGCIWTVYQLTSNIYRYTDTDNSCINFTPLYCFIWFCFLLVQTYPEFSLEFNF